MRPRSCRRSHMGSDQLRKPFKRGWYAAHTSIADMLSLLDQSRPHLVQLSPPSGSVPYCRFSSTMGYLRFVCSSVVIQGCLPYPCARGEGRGPRTHPKTCYTFPGPPVSHLRVKRPLVEMWSCRASVGDIVCGRYSSQSSHIHLFLDCRSTLVTDR
jgi:hypothetical protein